jgi:hypothetical protein
MTIRTMRRVALTLGLLVMGTGMAQAAASGPDYWAVTGVASGGTLPVYEQASAAAPGVGEIPPTGHDIKNLGCQGAPTFTEWAKMSEAERQEAAKLRWCKVRYGAIEGWVNGRFLVEDAGTTTGGK